MPEANAGSAEMEKLKTIVCLRVVNIINNPWE
jgi:hypothetical protein